MAITTINSASSLFEGTDSAEIVRIDSGGATNTTVNAAGGNDSIFLLSAQANATALYVDANAGADEITLSGDTVDESTLIGGAGGDTITFTNNADVAFTDSLLKAGDGSDQVVLAAGEFSGSTINGGSGADTITISGAAQGFTGLFVQGGSGTDTINLFGAADLSASTVYGGGGDDDIVISGLIAGESLVLGDSTVNGGGADTILIRGREGEVTIQSGAVKGKGGADEITITGTIGASATVEGNAGADQITLNGVLVGDASFIAGGSGNDTITISGNGGSAVTLMGGGGSDTIILGGGEEVYNGTGTKIYGGAGADQFELDDNVTGQEIGAAATGIISLETLSDSSLDAIDVVSGAAALTGLNFALDTAAGITSFTIGVFNDSDTSTPSITAGVVSGATFESADSTLTARAEQIDSLLSTKGTIVNFAAGGTQYLFIQGGTSGTSDDAVIQISEAVSGGTINTATDYQFYVGF